MVAEINRKASAVEVERMDEVMPLITECLGNGQSVRFSPRGTSMLPMIRQGKDTVTISPIKNELKRFDIALYTRKNGKHILHRIVKTGETYTCIGDNQYEYETGLKGEQFIGVVTSFSRNGKDRSVADKWYMLYCRIWHHSRKIRYFVYRVVRKLSGMLKNGRKQK